MRKALALSLGVCIMLIANLALAAPDDLEAKVVGDLEATSISDSQINLSWTDDVIAPTVEDGYKIERDDGSGFIEIGTVLQDTDYGDGELIEYGDTGLSEFTEYTYRVRAFKGSFFGGYSNEASATTEISPPTTLTAEAISASQINLSWTDNSGVEDGFIIERDSVDIDTVPADTTTYSDTGLSPGTEYTYRVRAYVGEDPDRTYSDYSNEASATTLVPDIAVDPESWDYGTVDIPIYDVTSANYSDKTFVVTNEGEATLDVSSTDLSDTDNFSIMSGGGSFSLEPGETHDIVVRFDPILPGGAKSATLSIVSNDPDEGTFPVLLSGEGRVTDLDPPEIVSHSPQDGSILNVEPQDIQIVFDEPMDTESVLKNSEFVRINITDDVTEMQASINTFLYWFGDPDQADKYDSYGCQGPYGISPGESGMVDVTFNDDRDTLDIHIEDITVGQPNKPVTEDTEYRLTILINGAKDDAGNTLELTHVDYTYFLTQQEPVTTGEQSLTLLHDGSLTVNIPAGALSEETTLTAYTHFYPTDTLPAPLWAEFGKIGFIKAFHLELESGSIVSPIELQVQYNEGDIPGGADEESLRLYQRDGDKWILLVPSIADTGNNVVSYDNVTELGDFAVLWGYPYGDAYPDGVIDLLDILAFSQDVALYREIFAPEPLPVTSDDPYMRNGVGNVHAGDDIINAQDTQEVIQVYLGVLDHFTILDTTAGPRLMTSHSPSVTHTAFLSSDIFSNRVSIILDNATDVLVADVELTYDSRLLRISEVSKTSLTSDSLMSFDNRNAGKLRLILVNGLPLNGAGSLVDVQFELMPGVNSAAAFDSIKLTKIKLNAGLIETAQGKLPQKLTLLQNYPNPFNPETWIPYELNQTADVEIRIYNVNGQVVRKLSLGQQLPGSYVTKDKAVYWDGTNDEGEKVSSGVYFYQLKAGEKSFVRKMVIIK